MAVPLLPKLLLVVWIVMLLSFLFGCGGTHKSATIITPSPTKVTTPELVRDLKQEHADMKPHLDDLSAKINAIPDAAPEKQILLDYFRPLPIDWSKMNVTLGNTEKSVEKDVAHTQDVEKKNAVLEANDPARAELRNYGVIAIIVGCVALAAYFFASSIPYIGPIISKLGALLRDGAIVVIGLGFVLITLARFLSTIEDIFFWTGLAGLAGVLVLMVIKLAKNHWQLNSIMDAIPIAQIGANAPPAAPAVTASDHLEEEKR